MYRSYILITTTVKNEKSYSIISSFIDYTLETYRKETNSSKLKQRYLRDEEMKRVNLTDYITPKPNDKLSNSLVIQSKLYNHSHHDSFNEFFKNSTVTSNERCTVTSLLKSLSNTSLPPSNVIVLCHNEKNDIANIDTDIYKKDILDVDLVS